MEKAQGIALAGFIGSFVMLLLGIFMFHDKTIIKITLIVGVLCFAIFITPSWLKNKPYFP